MFLRLFFRKVKYNSRRSMTTSTLRSVVWAGMTFFGNDLNFRVVTKFTLDGSSQPKQTARNCHYLMNIHTRLLSLCKREKVVIEKWKMNVNLSSLQNNRTKGPFEVKNGNEIQNTFIPFCVNSAPREEVGWTLILTTEFVLQILLFYMKSGSHFLAHAMIHLIQKVVSLISR